MKVLIIKKSQHQKIPPTPQNSNSSKKVRSPKVIYVPVSKPTYPHIKPIGRVAKQSLLDKLAYLKAQDELKLLDHIKNELEGQCYKLREFIETHHSELLQELSGKILKKQQLLSVI